MDFGGAVTRARQCWRARRWSQNTRLIEANGRSAESDPICRTAQTRAQAGKGVLQRHRVLECFQQGEPMTFADDLTIGVALDAHSEHRSRGKSNAQIGSSF